MIVRLDLHADVVGLVELHDAGVVLEHADAPIGVAQSPPNLDRRGEDPSSSIYPLARLWLARTQAQAGDAGKARLSYEAFLSAWPEADQDLKPLIEARQELARLK